MKFGCEVERKKIDNTPISRSRHFEIESEAPVGRNPEVLPLITGAAVILLCSRLYILSTKKCDKELSFHRFPINIYIYIYILVVGID